MCHIRHVSQVFFARESVEIELRRIGTEILVPRRIDDVLRHRQAIPIRVGIFDVVQQFHSRIERLLRDFVPEVVAHRQGIKAVDGDMVPHRKSVVQAVDRGRHDRRDTFIDGGGAPGRPAAFGTAGNHELFDFDFSSLIAGEQFLDAIHRADRAFDHRQAGGPFVIASL